ncbi:putative RNA methylase [Catenuloplanes nepalensis]|uniref:RNA methylase n=1 Tax=Catenuloplanes nepalensis TaxID=587533 RepID=A0ABT9MMQ1_9ACTN|nr:class I SAM-dependent methyltransferase [Catenuloplanes nepalensis]MDP9792601.1 putative RNA methylase [Catenuloplanes nepalensis]
MPPRTARTTPGRGRTPDQLADLLCGPPHHDLPWLPAGARILVPSAGDGTLVAAILRANPAVTVTAVEPDPFRAAACAARRPTAAGAVQVHVTTFEKYASTAIRGHVGFDGIVMDPPFMLPGQADVWFEHLRLAWRLLRPGGRLAAVVPGRFTHRSVGTDRDARQFVEQHGSHELLPARVLETSADTRIVRVTTPLRTGSPEYLLGVGTGAPVRVYTPVLTAAAVMSASAQIWHSAGTGSDRVLRYRGRCVVCRWLLWGFDDGDHDPDGVLGSFSAGVSLHPDQYGLAGPSVGLCRACGSDGDRYRTALARARTHWLRPAPALAAL